MADQDYTLNYKSDNSDILAKSNVVVRILMLIESIVTRLTPNLGALFGGAGKSAGAATPKLQAMATALTTVQASANSAGLALSKIGPAAASSGKGARSLGSSLGSLNAGIMLARQLFQVMKELGQAINEARDFSRELGQETLKTLDQMREISFLRGEKGPTPKVTADILGRAIETGSSLQEMTQFHESFEGAIPAARSRKNITPEIEKGLETEAATYANRTGLDQETAGKLAGLLGEYSKIESTEQGAGQIGMIGDQLNLGVGKLRQLAKPLLGVAGSMVDETGGRIQNLPELAAIYGTMTTRAKSPSVAATQIKQVNRLVTKKTDENKALRDKAVITDQDDYVTAVRKIAPLITGADGDNLLKGAGYGNSTERDSTIAAARSMVVSMERVESVGYGKTPEQRRKLQEEAGRKTIADNKDFIARDETGRVDRAKLGAARFAKGMETKDLESQRAEAMAELIAEDKIMSPDAALMDKINGGMGFKEAFGAKSQELTRIDQRVAQNLIRKAKAVGIDAAGKYPALKRAANGEATQDEKHLVLSVRQIRAELLNGKSSASGASPGITRALERAGGDVKTDRDGSLFPTVGEARIDKPYRWSDVKNLPGPTSFLDSPRSPGPAATGRPAPAGGGLGGDPEIKRLLVDQLKEAKDLNRKVGGNQPKAAPAPAPPRERGVDEGGSVRR